MVLSDQINYLGANSATTAAEIAQVVNDAAGLGQIAGMDVAGTAALADAMLAMGVSGTKAATGISRIYTNLSLGASATKAQKDMWESLGYTAEGIAKSMQVDATGTMMDVFTAIGNMDASKQVAALKTLFGQWAIQGAAKLTGNLGAFTKALSMVNDPSLYTGSMEREFIIKASNSEAIDTMIRAQIQHLKAYASAAALNGECVDPRFSYVTRGCAEYVEWLGQQENPAGKGWATGAGYGEKILSILKVILAITETETEEDEMRYNKISDMPSYAQPTIIKMVDAGLIGGTGTGDKDENNRPADLDLSMDMIRVFVTNDRAGLYDKK